MSQIPTHFCWSCYSHVRLWRRRRRRRRRRKLLVDVLLLLLCCAKIISIFIPSPLVQKASSLAAWEKEKEEEEEEVSKAVTPGGKRERRRGELFRGGGEEGGGGEGKGREGELHGDGEASFFKSASRGGGGGGNNKGSTGFEHFLQYTAHITCWRISLPKYFPMHRPPWLSDDYHVGFCVCVGIWASSSYETTTLTNYVHCKLRIPPSSLPFFTLEATI